MSGTEDSTPTRGYKISRDQWRLFFVVLVLGIAGLFFFILVRNDLNDSAALYVGLPILIALGMSLTPKAKSAMGATMKGLTIALLLSVPVFQEGYICVILAAPILYGVAASIAWPIDRERKEQEKGNQGTKLQVALITIIASIAALEGTHDIFTFERHNVVESTRVINADVDSILATIAEVPSFEKTRPFFIRLFPLPETIEGSGLAIGDERKIHLVYNRWPFIEPIKGDAIFRITDVSTNYVRFDIPQDTTFLNLYLDWESSEVFLQPINENQTQVIWRLSYQRKLDPIWYFGPMQQYAVRLAAETLIDNVADPAN